MQSQLNFCKLFIRKIIFLDVALHCTAWTAICWSLFQRIWHSFCHFGYFMKEIVFLCCCSLHCTDSHMLKPISKDDVGIQCEFMMCSAQRKTKIGYYVPTSVDSEYLLTRVLTREYIFFDTFWHSSLLEFDLSLLTILERVEY